MPKISLIFRCWKGLIATLLKFAKMQKSANYCNWREIWKAPINSNMFLPYHAKNQPHFQVSERTFNHFIEICKIFAIGGKFEKIISIQICFYPSMPKIRLIFRCPKRLIATLLKFAKRQKSADFCNWQEIWKAHINSNMFLPYHAKNQPHFQVSERTYNYFIEICKDAKISWFLQMAGNLKSSYQFKHVFTLPCQKSASFSGVQKDL